MTGRIFDIQRFSIHDGPGIRTTVFMQGCPLRCHWCHNPEGMEDGPLLSYLPERCLGCGHCCKVCPQGAHRMEGGGHVLHRSLCVVCGQCVVECCSGALEQVGKEATVAEVINVVLRDGPFYATSGGGVTLSGGEPMHQPAFAEALLRRAKAEGLHTCMETSAFAPWDAFERILPLADLFLADVKEMDPARHREFTGADNAAILQNIRKIHDAGRQVALRLPLIPGYNDREDHFDAFAEYARNLPNLAGIQIMPYHPLGASKAERMALESARHAKQEAPPHEMLRRWFQFLKERGVVALNPPSAAAEAGAS